MKYMNWCVYAEAGKFFQTIYFRKLPFYTHIVKIGNTTVLPHGRIARCKRPLICYFFNSTWPQGYVLVPCILHYGGYG